MESTTLTLSQSVAPEMTSFLPAIMIDNVPAAQPQPATIKMEDLETNPSTTDDLVSTPADMDALASSNNSSTSDSKNVKKRKSWGQVLPEPKTNLPPRKRAKTADEKEQRRIERVKRNRLAAHNSRERKRQEVEELQTTLDQLNAQLSATQELANRQAKELQYFRSMFPDAAASASGNLASLKVNMDNTLPNPLQTFVAASATTFQSSKSIASGSSPTTSPNLAPSILTTPDSLLHTIDSPATSPEPATPLSFENNSLFNMDSLKLDQTQHSAAMLWPGLQCQSTLAVPCLPSKARSLPRQPLSAPLMQRHRRYPTHILATTAIMLLNLTISSLSTLTSSWMQRTTTRRQTSQHRRLQTTRKTSSPLLSSFPNQTPSLLSSPPNQFLLSSPMSNLLVSYLLLSFQQTTMSKVWTRLMASLPNCTPAQAQQLLLATSQALLREKTFSRSEFSTSSFVRNKMTGGQADSPPRWRPKKIGVSGNDDCPSLGGGWERRFTELLASKRTQRQLKKMKLRKASMV